MRVQKFRSECNESRSQFERLRGEVQMIPASTVKFADPLENCSRPHRTLGYTNPCHTSFGQRSFLLEDAMQVRSSEPSDDIRSQSLREFFERLTECKNKVSKRLAGIKVQSDSIFFATGFNLTPCRSSQRGACGFSQSRRTYCSNTRAGFPHWPWTSPQIYLN